MKPLKLTIEGINSFLEPQSVDFSLFSGSLFCISGQTGSGKSTILDAILLALFNKSGNRNKLEDYINLKSAEGHIIFDFELEGKILRTERIISRKQNKNKFLLYDLDSSQLIAEGSDAFDYILEKLGINRDEFTKVVVLQQGEFAEFLTATKSKRNELIGNLFNLKRFRDINSKFSDKIKDLEYKIDACDKALTPFLEITADGIKEKSDSIKKLMSESQKKEKDEKVLKDRLIALKTEFQAYSAYLKDLQERDLLLAKQKELDIALRQATLIVSGLRDDEKNIDKLTQEKERLIGNREFLESAKRNVAENETRNLKIQSMRTECKELDANLKSLNEQGIRLENTFKTSVLEIEREVDFLVKAGVSLGEVTLSEVIRRESELKNEAEKQKGLRAEIDALKNDNERLLGLVEKKAAEIESGLKNKNELSKQKSEAEIRRDELRAEKTKIESQNAAGFLSAALKEGDLCPVCGTVITNIQKHSSAAEIDTVSVLLEKAEQAFNDVSNLLNKSDTAYALLLSEYNTQKENLESGKDKYDKLLKQAGSFDEGCAEKSIRSLQNLGISLKNRDDADNAAVSNKKDAEAIKLKLDTLIENGKKLKEEIDKNDAEIQKRVGDGDVNNLFAENETRISDCQKKITDFAAKKEGAVAQENDAKLKLAELNARLLQLTQKQEVKKVDQNEIDILENEYNSIAGEVRRLYGEVSSLSAAVENDKKNLETKKTLEAERAGYKKYADKLSSLFKLLRGNAFIEFISSEYIKDFTVSASEKMSKLSSGKYTLRYDEASGEFFVADFLSGNELRNIRTLSGGETFLASLAMATAISGEISRSRSFDFFFIDEGFGTLHEGAMDTVVAALNELSKNTTVGIITHREELKERIPLSVEIIPADEGKGSRIVV